jgi:hypothetical protein
MIELPNPLRDRRNARQREEGKPLSIRERLSQGMGPSVPKRFRKELIGVLLLGGLLIIVVLGLVVAKVYDAGFQRSTDTADRRAKLVPIELHPDDASRWDGRHLDLKDDAHAPEPASVEYFIDRLHRVYGREKTAEMVLSDRKQMLERWEAAHGQVPTYPEATAQRVMWDYPSIARGKFFRSSGLLLDFRPESGGLWKGALRDAQTGGQVHFYMKDRPSSLPEKGPYENIWCEIQGILLKIQSIEGPAPSPQRKHVPPGAAVLAAGTFREVPSPVPANLGRTIILGVLLVGSVIGAVLFAGFLLTRKYNRNIDMRIKLGLARMKRARTDEPDWKSIAE